jgi:hypothetical protein
MFRPLHARRSLALGAALVMTTWGAAAMPASADPGSGNSGRHAQSASKGQAKPGHKGKSGGAKSNAGKGSSGQGNAGGQGHGGGNGGGNGNGGGKTGQGNAGQGNAGGNGTGGGTSHGAGQGNSGGKSQGGGQAKGGSKGDPGGNNGTVKIAPLGEMDGIPNNSPHPGCTFQVEWYGFDEGADIVSTVGFAMHSPTKDVGLSIAGDTSVFVGGDPASGAGTATGLDGTEVYTLSFDGEPHPKQGYHVKLTVHTPRSNGNDSKTKVFWVEPCETAPGDTDTDEPGDTTPGTDQPGTDVPGSVEDETNPGDGIDVLGAQAADENDNGVSPAEAEAEAGAEAGAVAGAQAARGDDSNVPTAVDAGQSALDWVRSPLPLLIIALGAVLAAAAFVTRRRTRVPAGE